MKIVVGEYDEEYSFNGENEYLSWFDFFGVDEFEGNNFLVRRN